MTPDRSCSTTRRRLLAAAGPVGVTGLSGCTGSFGAGPDAEGAGTTATTTDTSLDGHPAATGVADQPRLGPPPTEAEGVVIAFEDPSCPRCAAFETQTVPKIRERLGDRVSLVVRSYPVVFPWGESATQAIEAAYAREMDKEARTTASTTTTDSSPYGFRQGSVATWALIRHYFEEQDQFDEENVLERTRAFLADETDLDADAVVADAEEKAHDDAVQADLSAGEAADVGQTTPTVFVFRDGEFRTRAKGSISFEVVKATLGL